MKHRGPYHTWTAINICIKSNIIHHQPSFSQQVHISSTHNHHPIRVIQQTVNWSVDEHEIHCTPYSNNSYWTFYPTGQAVKSLLPRHQTSSIMFIFWTCSTSTNLYTFDYTTGVCPLKASAHGRIGKFREAQTNWTICSMCNKHIVTLWAQIPLDHSPCSQVDRFCMDPIPQTDELERASWMFSLNSFRVQPCSHACEIWCASVQVCSVCDDAESVLWFWKSVDLEYLGIDPSTSRMLSERSTIWASTPQFKNTS